MHHARSAASRYANAWIGLLAAGFIGGTSDVPAGDAGSVGLLTPAHPDRPSPGAGSALAPQVSPDGSFIVFLSDAPTLVPEKRGSTYPDVFLWQRATDTFRLVSVNAAGAPGNRGSVATGFTPDGLRVAFHTAADNLAAGDTNQATDVFVRDLQTSETILVSHALGSAAPGNGASSGGVLTPDGRYVVFVSRASNLVADDGNGIQDVFRLDLETSTTVRASVGAEPSTGVGSNRFGGSADPAISADGRWVVFRSEASGLVPGVPAGGSKIYLRDMVDGVTRWISEGVAELVGYPPTGPDGSSWSVQPAISADGRYVAFKARNFSQASFAVFLYDSEAGSLVRLARDAGGDLFVTADAFGPVLSPDGRFVAYASESAEGVDGQIMLWDSVTKVTTLVSAAPGGAPASGGFSDSPFISPDGRWVSFVSSATNLVADPGPARFSVYRRDVLNQTTARLAFGEADPSGRERDVVASSMSTNGAVVVTDRAGTLSTPDDLRLGCDVFLWEPAADRVALVTVPGGGPVSVTPDGMSPVGAAKLSGDGRYLAFASRAGNLVTNDTNGLDDVFVQDLQTGAIRLVSILPDGTPANGVSSDPAISSNGRFVVFISGATNLVANDTNNAADVFVADLEQGSLTCVTLNQDGTGTAGGESTSPSISADGGTVGFASTATNLQVSVVAKAFYPGWNSFAWERSSQTTSLVTDSSVLGAVVGGRFGMFAGNPVLSPDGRWMAVITIAGRVVLREVDSTFFWSRLAATNVAPAFAAGAPALFYYLEYPHELVRYDPESRTEEVVSLPSSAEPLLGRPAALAVSADQRFTVFKTRQVWPGVADTNRQSDIVLYDWLYDVTTIVSANAAGTGTGNSYSDAPALSSDGRFVCFRSAASDLVPDDTNGAADLFLYDRLDASLRLVSRTPTGAPAASSSGGPIFGPAGNVIYFQSAAPDLVANDLNAASDQFYYSFTPSTVSGADSDGDGLPDAWELDHFQTLSRDGSEDFDGDGMSDLAEYRTGTVPTDPLSVFRGEILPGASANRRILRWPTTPSRNYQVEYRDALSNPWETVPTPIVRYGRQAVVVDSVPLAPGTPTRYYHVRAD